MGRLAHEQRLHAETRKHSAALKHRRPLKHRRGDQRGSRLDANSPRSIETEPTVSSCMGRQATDKHFMGPVPQRVVIAGNSQCCTRGGMGGLGVRGEIGGFSCTGQRERKLEILCLSNVFYDWRFVCLPTAIRCTNPWCERRCESAIREVRSIIRP